MRRSIGRQAAILGLMLLPVGGCGMFAAHSQVRGNHVDPDQLTELVPGISTRADAESLLGTPTAHASFDDNVWLYVGAVTRPLVAGTQHLISEENVALTFDQGGILRAVNVTTQKNALGETMIARTTPSPGSKASFMQELLGNVGRFNAVGGAPTNTAGTAAGAGADNGSDSSRFSTGN